MNRRNKLCSLVLSLILTACQAQETNVDSPSEQQKSDVITFSATQCYGRCPVYSLSIFADGNIIFNGIKYTAHEGILKRTIKPQVVKKIRHLLSAYRSKITKKANNYKCTKRVTDNPSFIIKWADNISYTHYIGCRNERDITITNVLRTIPEMAGVIELIQKPK